MAQECCPAIEFKCDGCGVWQFAEDTLEVGEYDERAVEEDHIDCDKCGKDNHVVRYT